MGENNINFTTISCVYDLLQSSEKACTWNTNGDISIMRPNVNTNLNSIKFRSFSANIRANINNLTSPIINAKLYGAFTWYKNQKAAITEETTTNQITGTEIPITPYISNLSCTIYNQTGFQQYEAANGLYHNDINNEIIFKEFGVPLNTTFQDAVYDMFHYAKYEFMKLLGIYDKQNNENIYNSSHFTYGEKEPTGIVTLYNYKYKWINSQQMVIKVKETSDTASGTVPDSFHMFGLTYDTSNPSKTNSEILVGGLSFSGENLLNISYQTLDANSYIVPFGAFKIWNKYHSHNDEQIQYCFASGYKNKPKVTVGTPWVTQNEPNYLPTTFCYVDDYKTYMNDRQTWPKLDATNSGYLTIGSCFSSGDYYLYTTYSCRGLDEKISSINDLKERRNFKHLYGYMNPPNTFGCITINSYHIAHELQAITLSGLSMIPDLDMLISDELRNMFIDGNYYLITVASYLIGENKVPEPDGFFHTIAVYANDRFMKIIIMLTKISNNYPDSQDIFKPFKLRVFTISLNKKFKFISQIWNENNYLEHLQDLNSCCKPNTTLIVLPKYEDGSNDVLFVVVNDGQDNDPDKPIYNWAFYLHSQIEAETEHPTDYFETHFFGDNVLYCVGRKLEYLDKPDMLFPLKDQISIFGPIINMKDETELTFSITSTEFYMVYHAYFSTYVDQRYSHFGMDITEYVHNKKISLPIYNAISNPTFEHEFPDPLTLKSHIDSLYWIIDANGKMLNLHELSFRKAFTFAQSALSLSFTYNDGSTNKTYTMYPKNPTINNPDVQSATTYRFTNEKHITSIAGNPYYLASDSWTPFLDEIFKVDDAGFVGLPVVPLVTTDGLSSGLLSFYVKFESDPAIFTFDPSIIQNERFANRYNASLQFIRQLPSLYTEKIPFDKYIFYNNQELYNNTVTYLELRNRDLTLKLRCQSYPSTNNIVFHLNETSMVDFKECQLPRGVDKVTFTIIDADNETLTPELAKKIYSNINICVDWTFSN